MSKQTPIIFSPELLAFLEERRKREVPSTILASDGQLLATGGFRNGNEADPGDIFFPKSMPIDEDSFLARAEIVQTSTQSFRLKTIARCTCPSNEHHYHLVTYPLSINQE